MPDLAMEDRLIGVLERSLNVYESLIARIHQGEQTVVQLRHDLAAAQNAHHNAEVRVVQERRQSDVLHARLELAQRERDLARDAADAHKRELATAVTLTPEDAALVVEALLEAAGNTQIFAGKIPNQVEVAQRISRAYIAVQTAIHTREGRTDDA